MHGIKDLVWKNYKIYTENSETVYGISKFFNCILTIVFWNCYVNNTSFDYKKFMVRDKIFRGWRQLQGRNKIYMWIVLQKQINEDEKLIIRFLDHFDKKFKKKDESFNVNIDRSYVEGCFGTVVYD